MTHRSHRGWLVKFSDYWMLTKPEVNFLVVSTTFAGFYLASTGPVRWAPLVHTVLGTLMVASGTATLNEYVERKQDARMRRTAGRPLPAGRLSSAEALGFGLVVSSAGGLYLWLAVNALASSLAILTLISYLAVYTPLKRVTPLCTLVGAIPGAVPPLIGWAGARGSLSIEAWTLYAILFVWQFPHFLAIAWMYREDYARAGFEMLPAGDIEGRFTGGEILAFTLALLPISLVPFFLGQAGIVYLAGAILFGLGFSVYGARMAFTRTRTLARRVLLASVIYLPLVFALMIVDKTRM